MGIDPEIRRYINIRLDEISRQVDERLEVLALRIRAVEPPEPDCSHDPHIQVWEEHWTVAMYRKLAESLKGAKP